MKNKRLSFRVEYEARNYERMINETSWFGIIIGFLLFIFGIYQTFCTQGLLCAICYIIAFLGVALVFLGTFAPQILEKPIRLIKTVFGFFGVHILRIFLLPVYLIMTIINIITFKKYSKNFSLIKWESGSEITPLFSDYKSFESKKYRYAFWEIVNTVLSSLVNIRMFVLIPIMIILLIMGLILFFASSNVIFSFVYTLF